MKLGTLLTAFGTFLVTLTLCSGIVRYLQVRHDADPVAIIAVTACSKWYGAAVVTGDGVVHPELGLTAEEAGKIAQGLGDGHSVLARIPCSGSET